MNAEVYFLFFIKQTVQKMNNSENWLINILNISIYEIKKKERSRNISEVQYLDLIYMYMYVQSKSYFNCSINMQAPS